MQLQNDFYTILEIEENDGTILAKLQLNAKHPIFEGHFPHMPITPGVVQLELIQELISLCFKQKIKLERMSNCKFLAILNPLKNPEINVEIAVEQLEENVLKATSFIRFETRTFLKQSARYLVIKSDIQA